ncbi:hypothetical protein Godav_004483 [Gossypium davidsonii]|uniref:Uncharacterized protein n=1 Tax=Gossypium davidsonii TaxID=34287 RepID=A0A7J8SLX5_GOSDV|nr:hypothetical protein [Gossypium davidsonii]
MTLKKSPRSMRPLQILLVGLDRHLMSVFVPNWNENSAFEDVLAPKHVPPLVAPSQATHPSSDINVAILDVLHSLSNEIWGFRYEVNTRLSSLEMQMTSLLAHHPSTPLFFLVMTIRLVIEM